MTYGDGDVHILAVDCGMKYNIIRSLVSAGIKLTVVPWCHVNPSRVCVRVCARARAHV